MRRFPFYDCEVCLSKTQSCLPRAASADTAKHVVMIIFYHDIIYNTCHTRYFLLVLLCCFPAAAHLFYILAVVYAALFIRQTYLYWIFVILYLISSYTFRSNFTEFPCRRCFLRGPDSTITIQSIRTPSSDTTQKSEIWCFVMDFRVTAFRLVSCVPW